MDHELLKSAGSIEASTKSLPTSSSNPTPSSSMAQSKTFLDRKRQRENDSCLDRHAKAKKIQINQFTTKLIDLNIDCLELIFKSLDLIDLLNVSDLSTNTMDAAKMVFAKKFSKYLLKIRGMESPAPIEVDHTVISISSVSECTKFLRVFGDSVKKLQLEYFIDVQLTADWNEVKSLIYGKCAKHLTELRVVNCDEQMFAGIESPLTSITKLRISCSRLGKCMELDKWFPSLVQMEMKHNDGCLHIVNHFPYLSFLAMNIPFACLSSADIETMFKSTPQLQTLSLSGGIDAKLLQFISENLTNLKNLCLYDFHLEDEQDDIVIFQSVEKLHITTGLLSFLPNEIPFAFQNLKELRVYSDSLGSEWIDFVLEQSNLERLALNSIWEPELTADHLIEFAQTLTKLTEIDVVATVLPDEMTEFLSQSKSLKKIRINDYSKPFIGLRQSHGKEWRLEEEGEWFTFERENH